MSARRVALVLLALSACGRGEPPRARFELSPVVGPRIAELEAEIAASPPIPAADPGVAEQVRGLIQGWPNASPRMRRPFSEEIARIGDPALAILESAAADQGASDASRQAAIELAGGIDTPAGADFLAGLVESSPLPWIRATAAWQLARSSQDQVVPRLLLRLKYELDGDTVIWMATALAHFSNWAGVEGLRVLAATGETEVVKATAAERLSALAEEAGVEDGETLGRLWDGGDPEGRLSRASPSRRHRLEVWRRIGRLAEHDLRIVDDARFVLSRGGSWTIDLLVEATHEETVYVRTHAVQCLERMGKRAAAAVPALVEALADPRLAPGAAAALGSVGSPDAADTLLLELDPRRDPDLRTAAVRALGRLGSPRAVEPLREILGSDEPVDLRQGAAESLLALGTGDDAVPLLVECLTQPGADASSAETALETWLAGRAERGDASVRATLERWRSLAPPEGETPDPAALAKRQAARAAILREGPATR